MKQKFAFIFPGQGSQKLEMLSELSEQHDAVRKTFDEASEALGYDLWALTQEGPEEKLNETACTQPALLAAGVAVWRVWQAKGGAQPDYLAGHSLGEYTALVCAGALPFVDAVTLVAARGRYMQDAVPAGVGAMAAIIGLDDDTVVELCDEAREDQSLSPANYNSLGQVVVAGHADAIDRVVSLASAKGARMAKRIPVSVPSHCSLMMPAAQRLEEDLYRVKWSTPRLPVVNNVDVKVETDEKRIVDALVRQLSSPVQWVRTVQYFAEVGVTRMMECGPGKVLMGLNKRITRDIPTTLLGTPEALINALNE